MSYLRPLTLSPSSLRHCALDCWLRHVLSLLRDAYVISRGKRKAVDPSPSFHLLKDCLRVMGGGGGHQSPTRRRVSVTSTGLSAYIDARLPASMQEEAFHRGVMLLRKESVDIYFDDLFPFFFCLLWRADFSTLDLPPVSDQENRIAVLDHLVGRISKAEDDEMTGNKSGKRVETAKFRLFDACAEQLSIEESYLMKRALRGMSHLRRLSLWWAADDAMLNIVGEVCAQLESADFWHSHAVTDLGVKMLLACDVGNGRSPLCATLKWLGLKETSCTHVGCLAAVACCPELEALTFSHTAVVKDFFAGVRLLSLDPQSDPAEKRRQFPLKTLFLPVTNGAHFADTVSAFPRLEDLRLWTTVGRLRTVSAKDLQSLRSLLLGGLHSGRVLSDLVQVVGHQLTTLKLETVLTNIPLQLIGDHCRNLVELQVINGRLVLGSDHRCEEEDSDKSPSSGFLSKLKLVYLFLVQYVGGDRAGNVTMREEENHDDGEADEVRVPNLREEISAGNPARSALHCILRHARDLEMVQANGCPTLDDVALKEILQANPLRRLRRFILTDASLQSSESSPPLSSVTLTSSSAMLLFSTCPLLQCLGDLRHWSVTPQERRRVVQEVQRRTGTKWIATPGH